MINPRPPEIADRDAEESSLLAQCDPLERARIQAKLMELPSYERLRDPEEVFRMPETLSEMTEGEKMKRKVDRIDTNVENAKRIFQRTGEWPHPFFPTAIKALIPSLLRRKVGDATRDYVNKTSGRYWRIAECVEVCASVDAEQTAKILRHILPSAGIEGAVQGFIKSARKNPAALQALQTVCPHWYQKKFGAIKKFPEFYCRADAYRVCKQWLATVPQKERSIHVKTFFDGCRIPPALVSGDCGFLGMMQAMSEENAPLSGHLSYLFTAIQEAYAEDKICEKNMQGFLREAALIPIAQPFVQKIEQQQYNLLQLKNRRTAWIQRELIHWKPEDRHILLRYAAKLPLSAPDDSAIRAFLEKRHEMTYENPRSAYPKERAEKIYDDHPSAYAVALLDKDLNRLRAAGKAPSPELQEIGNDETFRNAWTTALTRGADEHDLQFLPEQLEILRKNLKATKTGSLAEKNAATALHEAENYAYYWLRSLLSSKNPKAQICLDAIEKYASWKVLLPSLQLLPPEEASRRLTSTLISRLRALRKEMSYAEEDRRVFDALLADIIYRTPEQPQGKRAASLRSQFVGSLRSLFNIPGSSPEKHEGEEHGELIRLIGPNVFAKAVAKGKIRTSVPMSPEKEAELIATLRKILDGATDSQALSPLWRIQKQTREAVKELAPTAAWVGGMAAVSLGVVYGLIKLGESLHDHYYHPEKQNVGKNDPPSPYPYDRQKPQRPWDPKDPAIHGKNPLGLIDHLAPLAPADEKQSEESDRAKVIHVSEELTGDDRYLVLEFVGAEDPLYFHQTRLWLQSNKEVTNGIDSMVRTARESTEKLPSSAVRQLSIDIPDTTNIVPLPLRARAESRPSSFDDPTAADKEGTNIPLYQTLNGLYQTASFDQDAHIRFRIPQDPHKPNTRLSVQEIRDKLPAGLSSLGTPKLSPDILRRLAPALHKAVEEARVLPAHAAAQHLENAVRGFITYLPAQEYETLGQDGKADEPGRHEYLEMILALKKGKCGQAARLLEELLSQVGLGSITVFCIRADGTDVPMIPHAANGVPMIDDRGIAYLDIFDGTPVDLRPKKPELASAQTPHNPSAETGPKTDEDTTEDLMESDYLNVLKQRTGAVLLTILLAGAAAKTWQVYRKKKEGNAKEAPHTMPPIAAPERPKPVHAKPPVIQKPHTPVVLRTALPEEPNPLPPPPPKPKVYPQLEDVLPHAWKNQAMEFAEVRTGNLDEGISSHATLDVQMTSPEMLAFLPKLSNAATDLEQALSEFLPQMCQKVSEITRLQPLEQQQLAELLSLWMHRIAHEPSFLTRWLSATEQLEKDALQRDIIVELLTMLSHEPVVRSALEAHGSGDDAIHRHNRRLQNRKDVPALVELLQGFSFEEKTNENTKG